MTSKLILTALLVFVGAATGSFEHACAAEPSEVQFVSGAGKLDIKIGGRQFAEYFFDNPRPAFANVFSPAGSKITRNFPVAGDDDKDHPHHIGFFLTFGQLNGVDFWHLREKAVMEKIVQEPQGGRGVGTLVVQNRYSPSGKDETLLTEVSRLTVRVVKQGYRVEYDSSFTAGVDEVVIGSKEEGGLGVRVAKPLVVSHGGKMEDSEGRSGGTEIWGKQADWLHHYAAIDGQQVGIVVMPHPENFARCWWHARDYGLSGANPFGPLNNGAARKVLKRGETLRLRYGLLVYSTKTPASFDPKAAFADYAEKK